MKNVMYKILVGCYIMASLVLVCACNDGLDIQQAYPFTVETLPVPKKLKVGETAEIRCQLVRGGYYQPTTYQIRYFQPDGKGKLEMDNGTVFLPNDLYPLEKETFRLYYTSASTDQQTIDIYIRNGMTLWIFIGISVYHVLFITWFRHELINAPTDKELWGKEMD